MSEKSRRELEFAAGFCFSKIDLSANGEARFSQKRNFRFALPCAPILPILLSNSLKMKKQQLLP